MINNSTPIKEGCPSPEITGECFSVSVDNPQGECFSISTSDEFSASCFTVKCIDDQIPKPLPVDPIDLADIGFTKLYAIHATSVDNLYVVGLYKAYPESTPELVIALVTFMPASGTRYGGGIYKLNSSVVWITYLNETTTGVAINGEHISSLDAYTNVFSGYMALRYSANNGSILFISPSGSLGSHPKELITGTNFWTYRSEQTVWYDETSVRSGTTVYDYDTCGGAPVMTVRDVTTWANTTTDTVAKITGSDYGHTEIARVFEEDDFLVLHDVSDTGMFSDIYLTGEYGCYWDGTEFTSCYNRLGHISYDGVYYGFEYGQGGTGTFFKSDDVRGTKIQIDEGSNVDWTLSSGIVIEIKDDTELVQTDLWNKF